MLWANERVAEASTIAVAVTSVLKVMGSISWSRCPENPPAGSWFGRDVMRRIRKQQTGACAEARTASLSGRPFAVPEESGTGPTGPCTARPAHTSKETDRAD